MAAKVKIEVSHELKTAEAVKRVKALAEYWQSKYGIESRWTKGAAHLRGTVLGSSMEATIAVGPRSVVAEGPDPGILLRGPAASYVKGKLDSYLRPGE